MTPGRGRFPLSRMKVTYYLEVISSWCHWGDTAWAELKERYAGRVEFEWKIALMQPGDFPVSRSQCDWFYRRSGNLVRSPYMLNSAWMACGKGDSYDNPSLVAEAGKDFGITDDTIRIALSRAAVIHGRKVARLSESALIASEASGVPAAKLRARASSAAVRARAKASTAEFLSHRITQRPAFVVVSDIGDKAVFSGLARAQPVAVTIDAMLADMAGYATHAAHFGPVPKR